MALTHVCLNNITREDVRDEINATVEERMRDMGPFADSLKFKVVLTEVGEEAAQRAAANKRATQLKFTALQGLIERLDEAPNLKSGALSLYRDDPTMRRFSNIEVRTDSIIARNNSLMPSAAKLRPKVFRWSIGMQKKFNDDIRREAVGVRTGNPDAAKMAKEMQAAIYDLTEQYRAAGGQLRRLKGWFLPQDYNPMKVDELKPGQWADILSGKIPEGQPGAGQDILDRSRMTDSATDKPLDEAELRAVLEYSHQSITTGGMNKWKEPSSGPARRSLARRRDNARVLNYTPEGWLYVNQRFGNPDTVNAFLNWRDSMAGDTALMQIMGPNPDWSHSAIKNIVAHRMGSERDASPVQKAMERYHDRVTGRAYQIVDHRWHEVDRTGSSVSSAIMLSGAFLPAQGDWATQIMNSMVTKTGIMNRLRAYVSFMSNTEDSAEVALQHMMVADTLLSQDAGFRRFVGPEEHLTKWSRFSNQAASGVLEKTLLTPHTNSGRLAAINSHMVQMAQDIQKGWTGINPQRRAVLESYGIDRDLWTRSIQNAPLTDIKIGGVKAKVLDLNKLYEADPNAFERVHEMTMTEGRNSILTTDAETEELLSKFMGAPQQGTGLGLVSNWAKMFKRFPVAAFLNLSRVWRNPALNFRSKAGASLTYAAWSMAIGGMVLQSRQILLGKDPLDMDDSKFWLSALIYGGGLPFLGDVVIEGLFGTSDPYRYEKQQGYGPKESVAQAIGRALPPANLAMRILRPYGDVAEHIFDGDMDRAYDTFTGQALRTSAQNFTALFGGNHWLIRPMAERYFWSQWEQIFDPRGFRERQKWMIQAANENGQGFFWLPGEVAPRRAPE